MWKTWDPKKGGSRVIKRSKNTRMSFAAGLEAAVQTEERKQAPTGRHLAKNGVHRFCLIPRKVELPKNVLKTI